MSASPGNVDAAPFALCLFAWSLASCTDGQPIVLETTRIASPDSRWEAILEKVDNGLGFGQGMVFDEIHVQSMGSPVVYHGSESVGLVFYAEALSGSPTVRWVGEQRLEVAHSASVKPTRQVQRLMDVEIEYRLLKAEK